MEEILDKILDAQSSLTKGDVAKKFDVLLKQPDLISEISQVCEDIEELVKNYKKKNKRKKK